MLFMKKLYYKKFSYFLTFHLLEILVFLLFLSWLIYPLRLLWQNFDEIIFFSLNKILSCGESIKILIAWLNSRYGDWIYEGCVLLLYFFAAFKKKKIHFLYNFLFLVFCIFITQICVNFFLLRKVLEIARYSPSYQFFHFIDLSYLSFPNNRIFSTHSFPADHATTIFLCIIFSYYHLGKKNCLLLSIISCIFLLPRLIVGAHWLSDIIIGGGIIALAMSICCRPILLLINNYTKRKIACEQLD